jgi:hypothetical protein
LEARIMTTSAMMLRTMPRPWVRLLASSSRGDSQRCDLSEEEWFMTSHPWNSADGLSRRGEFSGRRKKETQDARLEE